MTLLTINLDPIAKLRTICRQTEPDLVQAAVLAELAGADGVSVSLRRDRAHVRERDLYLLRETVKGRLTLISPPVDDLARIVTEIKPHQVTLVADQADNDAPVVGIDFANRDVDFSDLVGQLQGSGADVVFYIDPNPESIKGASKAGANGVLIDCDLYGRAKVANDAQDGLDRIDRAAQAGGKTKLHLAAGHTLNYRNVGPLTEIGLFDEFVVGSALAARASLVGLSDAVREFKKLIQTDPT